MGEGRGGMGGCCLAMKIRREGKKGFGEQNFDFLKEEGGGMTSYFRTGAGGKGTLLFFVDKQGGEWALTPSFIRCEGGGK